MTGRSLPEVMMMMVPEAWEKDDTMPDEKKAFYALYVASIVIGFELFPRRQNIRFVA